MVQHEDELPVKKRKIVAPTSVYNPEELWSDRTSDILLDTDWSVFLTASGG